MILILNIIAKECTAPVEDAHMKLNCNFNGGSLVVGSKCTYSCDPGYTLIGAHERECRSDSQWSHDSPYCQG